MRWCRALPARAKTKTTTTTTSPDDRLTLVQIVRIRAPGVEAFRRYEALVLPLLSRHGGLLERRLRTADGRQRLALAVYEVGIVAAEAF